MYLRSSILAASVSLALAIPSVALADPILTMPEENLLQETIRPGGDTCAHWVNIAVINYKWAISVLAIAASKPSFKEESRAKAYEQRLQYLSFPDPNEAYGKPRKRTQVKYPETSVGYQIKKMLIDQSLAGMGKDELKREALTACRRYDPEFITPRGSTLPNPRLRTAK